MGAYHVGPGCERSQNLWERLREAQLSCGNTTVFVEYSFNVFQRGSHNEVQVIILVVNKVRYVILSLDLLVQNHHI